MSRHRGNKNKNKNKSPDSHSNGNRISKSASSDMSRREAKSFAKEAKKSALNYRLAADMNAWKEARAAARAAAGGVEVDDKALPLFELPLEEVMAALNTVRRQKMKKKKVGGGNVSAKAGKHDIDAPAAIIDQIPKSTRSRRPSFTKPATAEAGVRVGVKKMMKGLPSLFASLNVDGNKDQNKIVKEGTGAVQKIQRRKRKGGGGVSVSGAAGVKDHVTTVGNDINSSSIMNDSIAKRTRSNGSFFAFVDQTATTAAGVGVGNKAPVAEIPPLSSAITAVGVQDQKNIVEKTWTAAGKKSRKRKRKEAEDGGVSAGMEVGAEGHAMTEFNEVDANDKIDDEERKLTTAGVINGAPVTELPPLSSASIVGRNNQNKSVKEKAAAIKNPPRKRRKGKAVGGGVSVGVEVGAEDHAMTDGDDIDVIDKINEVEQDTKPQPPPSGPAYWLLGSEPRSGTHKDQDVKLTLDDLEAATTAAMAASNGGEGEGGVAWNGE